MTVNLQSIRGEKPSWLKVKAPNTIAYKNICDLVNELNLNTVCAEAACPNIGECWQKKHAAIMILGSICTRACPFCNVMKGRPRPVDPDEPQNVAIAVGKLQLSHVVITSVDRDDLQDGGASHFVKCIELIRETTPNTTIEVLTPDFLGKTGAVELLIKANPDVYNHNIETVPSLYKKIKPGAQYSNSLNLLHKVKMLNKAIFTKSGLMVGLGESKSEIDSVMNDLRDAQVDFLTMGQYLQPTPKHTPVQKYISPSEFADYENLAKQKGFSMVSASPFTRSSYHAAEDFRKLKEAMGF